MHVQSWMPFSSRCAITKEAKVQSKIASFSVHTNKQISLSPMSYQHSKTAISSLMSLQCSNPLLDDRFSADTEPPNGKQQNLRRHEWPSQQPRRECSDFRRIPMKSGRLCLIIFFRLKLTSSHPFPDTRPKRAFPNSTVSPVLASFQPSLSVAFAKSLLKVISYPSDPRLR